MNQIEEIKTAMDKEHNELVKKILQDWIYTQEIKEVCS